MANKKTTTKKKSLLNEGGFTQWGDPVLSTPTKLVTKDYLNSPQFKRTVNKMFKMIEGIGVGLAANQIGIDKRFAVVVINPTDRRPDIEGIPPTTLVNPKIIRRSINKQRGWEACLSCCFNDQMPWFYIERSEWIDVSYIDGDSGKRITKRINKFPAVVFQHEIDHLDGKVCGESVMVKNGAVVPGAIITEFWYRKTKGAPPKSLK